jgi:hypothetical protein
MVYLAETNQVTEQLLQIQVNQNNKPAQLAMSAFITIRVIMPKRKQCSMG